MNEMRCRVIATGGVAFLDVDVSGDRVAGFDSASFDFDFMKDQTLGRREGIKYGRNQRRRSCGLRRLIDLSHITNLTTAFSIERSLIENDLAFLALVQSV